MPADPAVRCETFTTDDPDAAAGYLAVVYDRSLRMSRLDGTMRHVRLDAGPFAVDDVGLPRDLRYLAESLGLLVMDVRGGEAPSGPGPRSTAERTRAARRALYPRRDPPVPRCSTEGKGMRSGLEEAPP